MSLPSENMLSPTLAAQTVPNQSALNQADQWELLLKQQAKISDQPSKESPFGRDSSVRKSRTPVPNGFVPNGQQASSGDQGIPYLLCYFV